MVVDGLHDDGTVVVRDPAGTSYRMVEDELLHLIHGGGGRDRDKKMNVVLESITSADGRDVSELDVGEVVEHEVELRINGAPRSFTVFLRANILEDVDANIVYGDELLEELLRFDPVALNKLYSAVGRRRRGKVVVLPLVLAALPPSSVGPRC